MKPDTEQVLFPNKLMVDQTVQLIDQLFSELSNLSKMFFPNIIRDMKYFIHIYDQNWKFNLPQNRESLLSHHFFAFANKLS